MQLSNIGLTTNNALSRNNEVQLHLLQAKLKTRKANNNVIPQKFVEGHMVARSDSARTDKKLMKVCKDFESIFVNQLFKVMRNTLSKKNNILHGGHGEEMFKDMLYQEYSKKVTSRSDFGFAKIMYDHLTTINRGY